MDRYLYRHIHGDLKRKMVLLSGPRQVGKTFLATSLMGAFLKPQYLNFDDIEDARIIRKRNWAHNADLLILDEIHKMRAWKGFLKGTFDTRPQGQAMLVTGSARLDTFRQSGESLAGRYFSYHLHPLSVRELAGKMASVEALTLLNRLGGFPEPFLSGSETEAARWRKQYYTDLVREDILEFSRIHEVRSMRLLVELLRRRVGSPLSYASIAGDLKVAPNTVRNYLEILQSLHIVFAVRPFHANVARAIQKEPKIYFYDSGYVDGDDGVRLENTVAVCLRKHVDFLQDTAGEAIRLCYVRTKERHEVDFALAGPTALKSLIEVKLSDDTPAAGLRFLQRKLQAPEAVQLVQNLRQPQTVNGIQIVAAADWLAELAA
ncbi:MAG: ATP-binding protein [Verrucomicrobia bacterium]|nr:ATP-binding protein [Verrucomicrobiota bacterium]